MEHTYAVIMAGGGGTRLWPISRKEHPKHMLSLIGERSLFQNTLHRLTDFIPRERIIVVTTAEQELELKAQALELPMNNYIMEPTPRGTASVVGLAAITLMKRDPDAVMLVLPADHFIRNINLFHKTMRVAIDVANKNYIVTIGITPTFPATGYGYIRRDGILPGKYDLPAYKVAKFVEKPDDGKARSMVSSGDHFWNSGMFVWRADRILDEITHQMPVLKVALDRIGAAWGSPACRFTLESEWINLKSETIDYGIMEHALDVAVLAIDGLEWSDVGSWDSLFDIVSSDKDGNRAVNSSHLAFDTHNSLVYSSRKKLVVTIGLNDLIIIDSGDALLVCRRDQAQQVRQVIEHLKKHDQEEYL